MSDTTLSTNEDLNNTNEPVESNPIAEILSNPETKAALLQALKSEIGPDNTVVKENIQKAYSDREAMAAELKELRKSQRDSELRQLEESGNQKKADAMRLKELQDQLSEYEGKFTNLTRDQALTQAMSQIDFKSEKAMEVARNDMVSALVKDSTGQWVSPTNQTIPEYVQSYAAEDQNAFLFKSKVSSGSTTMAAPAKTQGSVKSDKPVKQMSDEELVAHFNQS
jgi:hypothetical protein